LVEINRSGETEVRNPFSSKIRHLFLSQPELEQRNWPLRSGTLPNALIDNASWSFFLSRKDERGMHCSALECRNI
jgi:hypothetical protein